MNINNNIKKQTNKTKDKRITLKKSYERLPTLIKKKKKKEN